MINTNMYRQPLLPTRNRWCTFYNMRRIWSCHVGFCRGRLRNVSRCATHVSHFFGSVIAASFTTQLYIHNVWQGHPPQNAQAVFKAVLHICMKLIGSKYGPSWASASSFSASKNSVYKSFQNKDNKWANSPRVSLHTFVGSYEDQNMSFLIASYFSASYLFRHGFVVEPHLHFVPQYTPLVLQGQPRLPLFAVLLIEHVLLHEHEMEFL